MSNLNDIRPIGSTQSAERSAEPIVEERVVEERVVEERVR